MGYAPPEQAATRDPGMSPEHHNNVLDYLGLGASVLSPILGGGMGSSLGMMSPLLYRMGQGHWPWQHPAAAATPGGAPAATPQGSLASTLQTMQQPQAKQAGGPVGDNPLYQPMPPGGPGGPPAASAAPDYLSQINQVVGALPQGQRQTIAADTGQPMQPKGGGGVGDTIGKLIGTAMTVLPMFLAEGGTPEDAAHHEAMHGMLDGIYGAMQGGGVPPGVPSGGGGDDLSSLLLGAGEGGGGMPPGMGMPPGGDHEGPVKGPGAGMDDEISAQSDGGQQIQLSNDEFVIPADVVAMLGDGSSEAGADKLYEFINNIRQMKYGHDQQPEQTPDDVFDNLAAPGGEEGEGGGMAPDRGMPPPPEEEPAPEQEEPEPPMPKKRGGRVR
jgi:hypothetical protein